MDMTSFVNCNMIIYVKKKKLDQKHIKGSSKLLLIYVEKLELESLTVC